MPFRAMTPEEFTQEFRPVQHPREGELWPLERTPEIVRAADERRLWTAVDGDDGQTFYLSGWHLVNRFGYVVTERPYPEEEEIEVEFPPFGSCATCDGELSESYPSGTYCSDKCAEADV